MPSSIYTQVYCTHYIHTLSQKAMTTRVPRWPRTTRRVRACMAAGAHTPAPGGGGRHPSLHHVYLYEGRTKSRRPSSSITPLHNYSRFSLYLFISLSFQFSSSGERAMKTSRGATTQSAPQERGTHKTKRQRRRRRQRAERQGARCAWASAAAATWAHRRTGRRCLLQSTPTRCINPYDKCGGGKHTLRRRPRTTRRDEEAGGRGPSTCALVRTQGSSG